MHMNVMHMMYAYVYVYVYVYVYMHVIHVNVMHTIHMSWREEVSCDRQHD
jgi:hypothetical protein